MISLDTNVLVRIFVDDPEQPQQSIAVREKVSQYETVYISQVVQAEAVWVLNRAYNFSRKEIKLVLDMLLNNQSFKIEQEEIFIAASTLYNTSNIDFSGALILETSKQQNLHLLSFDKKLQEQKGVISL